MELRDLNDEELLRYSRHILLDEIGIEGQSRIASAKVLVVGAGGLGCPSALYLASAGVGTIYIADDDEVDLTPGRWVPYVFFTCIAIGVVMILATYIFWNGQASTLFGGLGLIGVAFAVSTQWY